MTEPTPIGRDGAVDAALTSLTAVGDRERQLLTPDSMAAIARAAAAERTNAGGRSITSTIDPPTEVPPLTVTAAGPVAISPRPFRGRSALALVAALLAVVGLGAAILAAVPQPIVDQDGASAGPAPAPGDASPSAERPILDLSELASTTIADPETAEVVAGDPIETTTTATTATTTVPSTTSEASTTQAPTSTATPPSSSEPVTSAAPAIDGPEATGEQLTIEIGVAATVQLAIVDNQPELGSIELAPGWSVEATEPRPGALGRRFTDDRSVASLEIWSEPGWFRLGVDHGDQWPSSTEWTRTITIDQAGTVDVTYGVHGLSGLEILIGDDWQHRVETIGPDHLLVTLQGPSAFYGRDIRVDAGRTTVDLRITGP